MTANFKSVAWSCDCSCSESLLYVLQNVFLVDSILHDLLIVVISHITIIPSCKFEFSSHENTHPVLLAAVGVIQSIGLLGVSFKTRSTNTEMTISGNCQWISMNEVSKCAEINYLSFNNLNFPRRM